MEDVNNQNLEGSESVVETENQNLEGSEAVVETENQNLEGSESVVETENQSLEEPESAPEAEDQTHVVSEHGAEIGNPNFEEQEPEVNIQQPQTNIKKSKFKKAIIIGSGIIGIVAITLFMIFVVFKHEHSWSAATCYELSRCYECGETRGSLEAHKWNNATCRELKRCSECGETQGYGAHTYQYGICSECGEISSEASEDITKTVKTIYRFRWILTFNDDVEIGQADDMNVKFAETEVNGNTCVVKGTIVVKCKNDKYYTDDFSIHLINQENDWVNDSNYDAEYNVQPIECYESGTIISYYYTQNPTYTYNTYKGKAKSTLTFDEKNCVLTDYDYYGYVDSRITVEYTIHHGVGWDIVILKGSSGTIELTKMDNGLIWDDMVFLNFG